MFNSFTYHSNSKYVNCIALFDYNYISFEIIRNETPIVPCDMINFDIVKNYIKLLNIKNDRMLFYHKD